MQARDLVIGAFTNYNWDKIKYWTNSLVRSGFTGDKVMIVYNSDQTTVNKLIDLGFKIYAFHRDQTGNYAYMSQTPFVVVVERFLHLWNYLDQMPDGYYRYVITTDVKDVVFQQNPSTWLENNLKEKQFVASCESLLYKDEPWGNDNLLGSYPFAHKKLSTQPIWNCGVQAGTMQIMRDLWLQIYLISKTGGRLNSDQAAYNLIINSKPWSDTCRFAMSESAWACQAGTTVDPLKIADFRSKLLEPEPLWQDGLSKTSQGMTHTIVHQWDRIPAWHNDIERRYG